jgi:hypothetical protein
MLLEAGAKRGPDTDDASPEVQAVLTQWPEA